LEANSRHLESVADLRRRLYEIARLWQKTAIPSHSRLVAEARQIAAWKKACGIAGLWAQPPLMVAATLDDGFGHGLEIVRLWAEAVGLRVHFLGLLQTPQQILTACRNLKPDLLGLTVLQFDTVDAVTEIAESLPSGTRLVAGGPLFQADPDLARRAHIDFAARHVADFVLYLLNWKPDA
jgi:methylmalonyl-CoA mutase cobalamin-binding subunit